MRDFLSMILLAVLLSGCAGPPRWVWKQEGYSDERMHEDLKICKRLAFQGTPGMPLMTPELGADLYQEREALVRRCMERRGYHYESVKRPEN
ncbi:MAG: hypothetical protein P8Z70_00625 [Desulfuromonadales bacterium]|jgi:hypothetical protein